MSANRAVMPIRNEHHPSRGGAPRACAWCGRMFRPWNGAPRSRFCSIPCAARGTRRRWKMSMRATEDFPEPTRAAQAIARRLGLRPPAPDDGAETAQKEAER